jgi:hypothetical protein
LLVTGSEENEIVELRFGGVVCVERRDDKKMESRLDGYAFAASRWLPQMSTVVTF